MQALNLKALYEYLELGFYVVPVIQRSFVWRNPQVLELAASIYKEIPIGAIHVCEAPQGLVEEYKELFKPLIDDHSVEKGKYIVLDGRQRLTSLLLIKYGSVKVENEKKTINLYFNAKDARFVLGKGKKSPDVHSFRVSDILQTDDVNELVESRGLSGTTRKTIVKELNNLRVVFTTYQIPIVNVEVKWDKDDLIKVFDRWSEVFVRLNSQGTKVKLPDLVLALITGKTVAGGFEPFRKRFHELMDRLSEMGYDVDSPPLIRTYLAISTGSVRLKDAKRKLDGLKPEQYMEYLKMTEQAILKVLDILKEYGVRLSYLFSNYLPVTPAVAVYNKYLSSNRVIDTEFKKTS
jgi:Protein of unknown function DUF262.